MEEIGEPRKHFIYLVKGEAVKKLYWRIDRIIHSDKNLTKEEAIKRVIDELENECADEEFDHYLNVIEQVEEVPEPTMEQIMREKGAPTLFPL